MPPTYEYICERGHTFEREQNIKDAPYKTCHCIWPPPTRRLCGAPVQRLISATSFILKGKGWAKEGYSK